MEEKGRLSFATDFDDTSTNCYTMTVRGGETGAEGRAGKGGGDR